MSASEDLARELKAMKDMIEAMNIKYKELETKYHVLTNGVAAAEPTKNNVDVPKRPLVEIHDKKIVKKSETHSKNQNKNFEAKHMLSGLRISTDSRTAWLMKGTELKKLFNPILILQHIDDPRDAFPAGDFVLVKMEDACNDNVTNVDCEQFDFTGKPSQKQNEENLICDFFSNSLKGLPSSGFKNKDLSFPELSEEATSAVKNKKKTVIDDVNCTEEIQKENSIEDYDVGMVEDDDSVDDADGSISDKASTDGEQETCSKERESKSQKLGKFLCDCCGRRFGYSHHLANHLKAKHPHFELYTCCICKKTINGHNYMIRHLQVCLGRRSKKEAKIKHGRRQNSSPRKNHRASSDIAKQNQKLTESNCDDEPSEVIEKENLNLKYVLSQCNLGKNNQQEIVENVASDAAHAVLGKSRNGRKGRRKNYLNSLMRLSSAKLFGCSKCQKRFGNLYSLECHLPCAHDSSAEQSFVCGACKSNYYNVSELEEHIMSSHAQNLHICTFCTEIFEDKISLKRHARSHPCSNRGTTCGECRTTFKYPAQLRRHLPCLSLVTVFTCDVCNLRFDMRQQLRKHLRAYHDKKSITCPLCDRKFEFQYMMKLHLKSHENGTCRTPIHRQPFESSHEELLQICEKESAQVDKGQHDNLTNVETNSRTALSLVTTVQNVITESNSAALSVESNSECTEESTNVSFKRPIDRRTCPECGITFKFHHQLYRHSPCLSSINLAELNCDVCQVTFKQLSKLRSHIRAYHNKKAVVCTTCGQQFEFQYMLKRHELTHGKDDVSGIQKRRSQACLEVSHENENGPKKLFVCRICDQSHDNQQNLSDHVLAEHGVQLGNNVDAETESNSVPTLLPNTENISSDNGSDVLPSESTSSDKGTDVSDTSRLTTMNDRKNLMSVFTVQETKARRFECCFCSEVFDLASQLLRHIDIHVKDGQHVCEYCGRGFRSARRLENHLPCASDRIEITCLHCGRIFAKDSELRIHAKTFHSDSSVKCHICRRFFETQILLDRHHMQLHKRFHYGSQHHKSPSTFKMRLLKKRMQNHVCKVCKMSFLTSKLLQSHVKECQANSRNASDGMKESGNKIVESLNETNKAIAVDDKVGYCRRQSLGLKNELGTTFKNVSHSDDNTEGFSISRQEDPKLKCLTIFCDVCGQVCVDEVALQEHFKIHKDENYNRGFQCCHCRQIFLNASSLTEHMKIHKLDVLDQCVICLKRFEDAESVENHHCPFTESPFRCGECAERFKSEAALREHFYKLHGHFDCDICNKKLSCALTLRRHKKAHDAKIVCEICGNSYSSYFLERHRVGCLMEMNGIKKCDVCGMSFEKVSALKTHIRLYHTSAWFECNLCQKRFRCNARLNEHMRSHTGEKPYKCSQCDKCYSVLKSLKMHLLRHSSTKNFPCNICKKSFINKAYLKAHQKCHVERAKEFHCEFCSQFFRSKANLLRHQSAKHNRETRYKCPVCNKGFNFPSFLKIHMFSHTGEKPCMCNICGKAFPYPTLLKFHMRSHTGEKPYPCRFCGRSFSMPRAMRNHERIHTGEKPYRCTFCGLEFSQSYYLKNHVRKVHEH